ncbi:MAG: DUF418 domain-containing protein [Bacteroidales bacterium]
MSVNYAPVMQDKRIELLDVIRGFAVFGILLANILFMSGFHFTPFSILDEMPLVPLNKGLYSFAFFTIFGKAYPMFCMLFGISFYLQYEKRLKSKGNFIRFFSWRMILLFLIGFAHLLLWPGDVVHFYALVGLLLIPFRQMSSKFFLFAAAFLFAASIAIAFLTAPKTVNNGETAKPPIANVQFDGVDYNDLKDKVQNEGGKGLWFLNKQQYNILFTVQRMKTAIIQLLAFFFLGIYLYTRRLITDKMYNWKYLLTFFILGAIGKYLLMFVSYELRIIEHVFWSLFFITLLGMVFKSSWGQRLLSVFKPVGRMALSNYILQSIIAAIMFYGLGFGLFGELPLYMVYIIALAILVVQTIFSVLWLNKFKFGPIEWFWRSLAYKKNFSLKIRS